MRDMKQTDRPIDDVDVLIEGAGDPMPARLVVFRKPEEAARAERERLERLARKKNKALDERSPLAAEFIVLATSLLALMFPAGQILAMYRLRWQIELAFKRLKSMLHLDGCPPGPARAPKAGFVRI
jgi:IS4 transposase